MGAVTNVWKGGKQFLEVLIKRGIPTRAGSKAKGIGERPSLELARAKSGPRFLQKSLFSPYLQQSSESFVANISREAGKKLWTRYMSNSGRLRRLAMYGFVGVSLANSPDTSINPIPICKHLADMFSPLDEPELESVKPVIGNKVADYEFGRLIAKGCDAAVYEVRPVQEPTPQSTASIPQASASINVPSNVPLQRSNSVESVESLSEFDSISSDVEMIEFEEVSSEPSDGPASLNQPESLPSESMCMKVMFNYGISSKSASIERAMRRELVPGLEEQTDNRDSFLRGAYVKKKRKRLLPQHPNIIPLSGWFVDRTPLLENALSMYPIALPLRLCEDGCGRNSTLFILMKRYESTLAEHLDACGTPETREGVLLLLQLLHAIQHMQNHGIAHRDLKSDNLLLEWSEGQPQLVVSDFGHCLTGPLYMPYPNDNMDKGGNGKLMAPEIATAEPGPGSYLDFRSSDTWAVGTIAYEIFGGANPFYTSAFDGRYYDEDELPRLPPSVPHCVKNVLKGMLRRNPQERMPSSLASTVLSLYLWAPEEWRDEAPSHLDMLRWLVHLSAVTLLHVPEHQQMALFLGQLQWRTLCQAVELMVEKTEEGESEV